MNINFEECGYESTFILHNASFTIWTLYANCVLFALWLLLKIVAKCKKIARLITKLADYLFWNGPIRLFMEVFFEVAFASALNLYVVEWDTPFFATKYSNIFALVIFITFSLVCIFLIIFYAMNLGRIN